MKTRAEYIDILQNYAPELQTRFGITSMCMFGFVACGEHQADSDIDLFVSMPPVFSFLEATDYFLTNLFEILPVMNCIISYLHTTISYKLFEKTTYTILISINPFLIFAKSKQCLYTMKRLNKYPNAE